MVDRDLERLRRIAALLDSRFRVPGTNIRFGLDPILSLIPGLGDLTSPLFALALIVQGLRQRVPKIVLTRMMLNALVDAVIGAVPIAGTIGDVFFRANLMNLRLLERHAHPGRPPETGDYVFVFAMAAVCGLLVAIPAGIGIWLTYKFLHWLG